MVDSHVRRCAHMVRFDQIGTGLNPPDYLADSSRTLADMFLTRVERSPARMAWMRKVSGQWMKVTYAEFGAQAQAVAAWLRAQGLGVQDKVCIIGSTRPEWCLADIGGLLAGCVTVGAYPTLAPMQLAYLLEHSDASIVFVEGQAEADRLLEIREHIPEVRTVVVWESEAVSVPKNASDWFVSMADVLATDAGNFDARAVEAGIDPDDTAIIVYTSGTTGPPKGAMITHRNILEMLAASSRSIPNDRDDFGLSFLPMAHVAERVLSFYGRVHAGTGTAFASSIAAVLEEIVEVRPTVFGSVPRIFEKAYAKIMSAVEEAPPARQKIFRWAERVGRAYVQCWQQRQPVPWTLELQYRLADRLVFSKLRGVFGGRVRQFITGAAPIAYEILEFFWAAGFPVFEVYGQTEATTVSHMNRPGQVRLGSVGRPLDGIESKLAEDGEILVRGPIVFKGYYKNPEATAEAIDDEGWLHTGDIGRVDDDGYFYIVDRKKHIIITAGGKNLTPANIENALKASDPMISQVHAHGDRRPYVSAIVTLSPVETVEYAAREGLLPDGVDRDALIAALTEDPTANPPGLAETIAAVSADPRIRERIREAIARGNEDLARVEQVKRFVILDRDFSVEAGELTPTLKVKRKAVEEKYKALFDRIYDEDGFAIVVTGA
ncbi:MAG: long-chain fatty acid--CoA ligase [Candidatus Dadabacteria bacterium]|nr:MAG: long-chain fatty acid--CoA ligase [Candidatus Dadabacteria bacterium]